MLVKATLPSAITTKYKLEPNTVITASINPLRSIGDADGISISTTNGSVFIFEQDHTETNLGTSSPTSTVVQATSTSSKAFSTPVIKLNGQTITANNYNSDTIVINNNKQVTINQESWLKSEYDNAFAIAQPQPQGGR